MEMTLKFEQALVLFTSNCYYCNVQPSNVRKKFDQFSEFKYNGIDRVDNTKGYTLDNSVACCRICNWMKQKLSQETFFEHIKKIIYWQEKIK